jgi:hypothetical protein
MSRPDPSGAVSVRTLLRVPGDDDLLPTMIPQLPASGLAAPELRKRGFDLRAVTYRLLDSRILEAALSCLNQDVARPLADCLAGFGDLRSAAAKTLDEPDHREVVDLWSAAPLTSTQRVSVTLTAQGGTVAVIRFRFTLSAELLKIAAAVSAGAVEELICQTWSLSGTLSLESWPTPLWSSGKVGLPDLHLPVRPPVHVPLVPVPRPPTPSTAGRRSAGTPRG